MPETRWRRHAGLFAALWAAFACLTLAGGYAMLRACDLGFHPLFGASACAAPPVDPAVAAARERQDKLRTELHAAEMRLAQLPICLPPQQPPLKREMKKEEAKEEVKKQEAKTDEPRNEEPKPEEKFKVPEKVTELQGCWQSVRGDIEVISNDAEKRHIGSARLCYCFKNNGRGASIERFTDGDVCQAPLTAKVVPGKQITMHHEKMPCHTHGFIVGENITCSNNGSDETSCEIEGLGKYLQKFSEQFKRVSEEYCGWSG